MFAKILGAEKQLEIPLDEPLTTESCKKLIIEFVKYLLYQKQQIPFSYDSLTKLQAQVKPTHRSFSSIKNVLNSLEDISRHLSFQFRLQGCDIKEIVVIFGATIVSPKLCIAIELPTSILNSQNHMDHQHSPRKPLLNLMKAIMESSEFQEAMALPLNPTNTFFLLKKSDSHELCEFFLPKPQYEPPSSNQTCFRIKFQSNENMIKSCNCMNLVRVYNEFKDEEIMDRSNVQLLKYKTNYQNTGIPYTWYQSKEVLRGFKFSR